MHQVKKSEGWNRVPNREMWGGIFGAARDGCKFVFSKLTGREATYASL